MALSLLLLLILAGADGSRISNRLKDESQNVLAVQWPPDVCKINSWTSAACRHEYWTIHGWWPPRSNTHRNNDRFEMNKIKDLSNDLNQLWPNLSGKGNKDFWKHEWNDHGTTADRNLTVRQYFFQTVDYYNRFIGSYSKCPPKDIKNCFNQNQVKYLRDKGELHLTLPNNFI